MVIGLTGGIASGKSTVSRILRELGAEVIDADLVAREVMRPGTEAWRELVNHFGPQILDADGSINRRRLGRLVFTDPAALAALNEITHPCITRRIQEQVARARQEGRVVVVDAPLLIEAGMHRMVDEVWLVVVEPGVQVERVMRRDNLTYQEALSRLRSQMPLEEKKMFAHHVIDNSGPVQATRARVVELWNSALRRAGGR